MQVILMIERKRYITTVQQYEDTEEQFIELPDEICQELGWKEGTEIEWEIKGDSFTITEVKDTTMPEQEPIHPHDIIKKEIQEYLNSESEGKEYKDNCSEED